MESSVHGTMNVHSKGRIRGQAVTEYLVTYSWVIAIVAVILVALFELGIFSTPNAPGACIAKVGYICADPVYTGNGITFIFGQVAGQNQYYYGDWVFVASEGQPINSTSNMPLGFLRGAEQAASGSGNVLTPGQTIVVNFTNFAQGNIIQNPAVGTSLYGNVWLGYCTSQPCNSPAYVVKVATITVQATKSGTVSPYGNLCSVSGKTLICTLNNQTITCVLNGNSVITGCNVPLPTTTTVTTTIYNGPTTDIYVNSTGQSGIPVTLAGTEYFTNTTVAMPYPPNAVVSLNFTKTVYGYFGGSRANFTNSTGSTCTLNGNETVTITPGCMIRLNYAQQYEFEILEQLGSGIPQNTTAYGSISLLGGKNVEWFSPHTNVTFSVGANPGYAFTGFTVGYGSGYSGADVQNPYKYSNGGSFSEGSCWPGCNFQQSYSPSQSVYLGWTTSGCGGCGGNDYSYTVSYVPAHVNMTGAIVEIAQFSRTNGYLPAGAHQVSVSYSYQNCTYNYTQSNNNWNNGYNDRDYYYLYCNTIASGTESVPITTSAPVANWSSGFGDNRMYYFGSPESYYYYSNSGNNYGDWGITNGYSATNLTIDNVYPFHLNATESAVYASIDSQVNSYISSHAPTGPAPSWPPGGHQTWYSYSYNYLGVPTTHGFALPGNQEYSYWFNWGNWGTGYSNSYTEGWAQYDGGYIYGLGS